MSDLPTDDRLEDLLRRAYPAPAKGGPSFDARLRAIAFEHSANGHPRARTSTTWLVGSFVALLLAASWGLKSLNEPSRNRPSNPGAIRHWLVYGQRGTIRIFDRHHRFVREIALGSVSATAQVSIPVGTEVVNVVGYGQHELRKDRKLLGYAEVIVPATEEHDLPGSLSQTEWDSQVLMLTHDGDIAQRSGPGFAMGIDKPLGFLWKVHGPATIIGKWSNGQTFQAPSTAISPSISASLGFTKWPESSPAVPTTEWRIGVLKGLGSGYGVFPIRDSGGKLVTTLEVRQPSP